GPLRVNSEESGRPPPCDLWIDRVFRAAAFEADHQVIQGCLAHAGDGGRGVRSDMWEGDYIGQRVERVWIRRLLGEDVGGETGQAAGLQRRIDRLLVHESAAGTVDEKRGGAHLRKLGGTDQP